MTTLYPEIEHGEGGDTAAEGATACVEHAPRHRKPRARNAARQAATPKGAEPASASGAAEDDASDRRGPAETWHGLTACYWLVYPHSVHAVSAGLAAKFCDAGKVITLGTWADAEAVRVGMEQTAVPHPAPGALPGVGVGS